MSVLCAIQRGLCACFKETEKCVAGKQMKSVSLLLPGKSLFASINSWIWQLHWWPCMLYEDNLILVVEGVIEMYLNS